MLTNVEGHETTWEAIAIKRMVLLAIALELNFGEARKVKRGFFKKLKFFEKSIG